MEYENRDKEELIDITKVELGVVNDEDTTEWRLLERTDETPRFSLNQNKKTFVYKDIEIESEYYIDEDGRVILSKLPDDSIKTKRVMIPIEEIISRHQEREESIEQGLMDDLDNLPSDDDYYMTVEKNPKKIKSFLVNKTIWEILQQSKPFFDDLVLSDFAPELESIRKDYDVILDLYRRIGLGEEAKFTVSEILSLKNAIIRMYTYAFGNPLGEEELKDKAEGIMPRNPNDLVLFSDIYLGGLDINVNTGLSELKMPIRLIGMLEKMPNEIRYYDETGKEVQIRIFRDMKNDFYYYVRENDEVFIPEKSLIDMAGVAPSDGVVSIKGLKTFKEAFDISKEDVYSLPEEDHSYDKIKETFKTIEEGFILQERGEEGLGFSLRDLEFNSGFLWQCYNFAFGPVFERKGNEACLKVSAYGPRENPYSNVMSAFSEFYLLTDELALLMNKEKSY